MRFDAIGHTERTEWFCVLVYDGPAEADLKDIHLMALRNAIAFADGTRFESKAYWKADARGFAAYELWLDALETEEVSAEYSRLHAWHVAESREHAAAYLRGLVDVFPAAASQLEQAAARKVLQRGEASRRIHRGIPQRSSRDGARGTADGTGRDFEDRRMPFRIEGI